MIKFKVVVCVCLVHFFTISIVQCAKSITKRSLFFPFTTILQFNYGLSVPITIDGAPGGTTIVLSLCFQGNFDLPKMTSDVKIHNLAKRDIEDNDISKLEFYYYVVQYLESLDLNGEECLLRMICEIAKYPMDKDSDDTVIEKVAHFLFTPSTRTDEIDNEINNPYLTDLLEAEEEHGEIIFLADWPWSTGTPPLSDISPLNARDIFSGGECFDVVVYWATTLEHQLLQSHHQVIIWSISCSRVVAQYTTTSKHSPPLKMSLAVRDETSGRGEVPVDYGQLARKIISPCFSMDTGRESLHDFNYVIHQNKDKRMADVKTMPILSNLSLMI